MIVSHLKIENFRGIKKAQLDFDGHALLIGRNNVGKSTICEALELALGSDRQKRFPVVEEYDFYNACYLDKERNPIPIKIEVLLTDVTPAIQKVCWPNLERWDPKSRRILGNGELESIDGDGFQWCLRLLTIAKYNAEEDEFEAATYFANAYDPEDEEANKVSRTIRRSFGFLYLRALRTGSRALSLERGSLLDVILRIKSLRTGIWENVRNRMEALAPPIGHGATELKPVLHTIEKRLAEYIPMDNAGSATRLYVSQLTREHLRKTLSFFVSITGDQKPVPFQEVGTGTLNTLVLALLTFIAELKEENVIFAMEEPEIALPPHTQRRIANYLLQETAQCFVTSHSPYVIERFEPEQIVLLRRDKEGHVEGKTLSLGSDVKTKTYRRHLRRGFAEAMLGRGVVIAEGITEQMVLHAVAKKMEEADPNRYPLDLTGITILYADGDGSMAEFCRFFVALDLPTFGFCDQRNREEKEKQARKVAGFDEIHETNYKGMEDLLVAEVPLCHQWSYLEEIRDKELAPKVGIPPIRPDDAKVQKLTRDVLKNAKGSGRAADLIDFCEVEELPPSVTGFLEKLYQRFPRPPVPGLDEDNAENATPETSVAEGGSEAGEDISAHNEEKHDPALKTG